VHGPHVFVDVLHAGVAPPHSVSFEALHCLHTPATQTGVGDEHWLSFVQPVLATQTLFALQVGRAAVVQGKSQVGGLQVGYGQAVQPKLPSQPGPHWPMSLSQIGFASEQGNTVADAGTP
jgi:hypothetical protein